MDKNIFKKILKYTGKVFSVLGITLLALLVTVYGVGLIITHGPSENARELFVLSMKETSAAKWVPYLFMSSDAVNEIIEGGSVTADKQEDVEINTDLIDVGNKDDDADDNSAEYDTENDFYIPDTNGGNGDGDKDSNVVLKDDGITIYEVNGSTYSGEMMVIDDPSRVFVATLDKYGENCEGITLDSFIKKYDAIGGTNAGGFYDPDGKGNGGTPDGLVIGNSQIMWGGEDYVHYCVIGFDENNILHVGNMSGKMALERKLISAVSFSAGPLLVVNGKPMNENKNLGGGLNPRTSIGQRADGAILLLVVDGRQANSLGATYDDLVDIMLSYGAVNAANLDGGSSTRMHYNGERINQSASLVGQRELPNAILVKKKEA